MLQSCPSCQVLASVSVIQVQYHGNFALNTSVALNRCSIANPASNGLNYFVMHALLFIPDVLCF